MNHEARKNEEVPEQNKASDTKSTPQLSKLLQLSKGTFSHEVLAFR